MKKILKHKLFLPLLVVSLLLVSVIVFLFSSKFSERNKIERFSSGFKNYQQVISDVSVASLLAIVDYSKDTCPEEYCGKDNFFSYLQKAIDFQDSNSNRAKNARLAIQSYETNQRFLDNFDSKNDQLDKNISEMLEIASSLKDVESREEALLLVKEMRSLYQIYEKLRVNEFSIFAIQRELLEKMVKENGAIPDLAYLQKGGGNIAELKAEQEKMFNEAKKLKQEIEDLFSVYKGRHGL